MAKSEKTPGANGSYNQDSNIVSKASGRAITLKTKEGQGSTFGFAFPTGN
jgi:hypothetical protein